MRRCCSPGSSRPIQTGTRSRISSQQLRKPRPGRSQDGVNIRRPYKTERFLRCRINLCRTGGVMSNSVSVRHSERAATRRRIGIEGRKSRCKGLNVSAPRPWPWPHDDADHGLGVDDGRRNGVASRLRRCHPPLSPAAIPHLPVHPRSDQERLLLHAAAAVNVPDGTQCKTRRGEPAGRV